MKNTLTIPFFATCPNHEFYGGDMSHSNWGLLQVGKGRSETMTQKPPVAKDHVRSGVIVIAKIQPMFISSHRMTMHISCLLFLFN